MLYLLASSINCMHVIAMTVLETGANNIITLPRGGSVAEWVGHRISVIAISSPALTQLLNLFQVLLVQLFDCTCTKLAGLTSDIWDS